jgi:hypothetical protein
MAGLTVMRGVNPGMATTADTVTSTISKPWSYISTILPQKKTHLKQTTAVVGVMVNQKVVITVLISTTYKY